MFNIKGIILKKKSCELAIEYNKWKYLFFGHDGKKKSCELAIEYNKWKYLLFGHDGKKKTVNLL